MYKIMQREYLNTGGNCMVLKSTVYWPAAGITQFVYCNEDGCTLASTDYLLSEDYDESMTLDSVSYDDLSVTNKLFELYRDCWIEYAKLDCKRFSYKFSTNLDILPAELRSKVDSNYIKWCKDNDDICEVQTDGYDVFYPNDYWQNDVNSLQKLLEAIDDKFEKAAESDQEWEEFLDTHMFVGFGTQTASLSYCAEIHELFTQFLSDAIKIYQQ